MNYEAEYYDLKARLELKDREIAKLKDSVDEFYLYSDAIMLMRLDSKFDTMIDECEERSKNI